ncbi:hypothetical protein ACIBMZ_09200 [Micromonospora sp. NPDC049900]|uniref:hypothetical protein n=1 Tax=Micromonospora sp. NPDC049900 TaxID=3364275 RepID=UPI0037BB494C
MIPLVVIAARLTAAEITPLRLLLALATVSVVAVPFTLLGLAIGCSLPSMAVTVVAQVVFLSPVMLGVWVVALAAVGGWAYRRDEGRRFS